MKKQAKNLKLNKQVISSLEANLLHGGAKPTMKKTCQSQDTATCAPLPAPQDPRPNTAVSKCSPCSSICG